MPVTMMASPSPGPGRHGDAERSKGFIAEGSELKVRPRWDGEAHAGKDVDNSLLVTLTPPHFRRPGERTKSP